MSVVAAALPDEPLADDEDAERIAAAQDAAIDRSLAGRAKQSFEDVPTDRRLEVRERLHERLAGDAHVTRDEWLTLARGTVADRRRTRAVAWLFRRSTAIGILVATGPITFAISLATVGSVATALGAAFSALATVAFIGVLPVWAFIAIRRRVRPRPQESAEPDRLRIRIHDEIIPQLLREIRNELRDASFSKCVALKDTAGLRDLFDERYEVETASGKRLADALNDLRAGSLGVFGPRGAGKSTLIEAAQAGRLAWTDAAVIGVSVPAPVRYEAREFVPFVFARLCLRVQEHCGKQVRAQTEAARVTAVALRGVIPLVFVSYLVMYRVFTNDRSAEILWRKGTATATVLALLAWLLVGAGRDTYIKLLRHREPLLAAADANLEALRYLETRTQETSGELSGAVAKLGARSGRSLAAQALTLPEMTARYREFMQLAVADHDADGRRRVVVVAIDELDKMESAQEAARFLNEVKALFGQGGVFYLVSLSDDAAASFEQRGVGIRDVFESVFDQVVLIEPLTPAEAQTLLARRIVGLQPPFAELCHAMSGGLPRELMRCARELSTVATRAGALAEIDGLVTDVLAERGRGRERALRARAVDNAAAEVDTLLEWLSKLEEWTTAEALLSRCDVDTPLKALTGKDQRPLRQDVLGLAAWWYHTATLIQFARDLHAEDQLRHDDVALLARGYLELRLAPPLAWATIDRFRTGKRLPLLTYPGVTTTG
jgi:hypothetical protein